MASGASLAVSASVRAEKRSCDKLASTPKLLRRPCSRAAVSSPAAASRPRMLCSRRTEYSSPVMNVANVSIPFAPTSAHLLCVPGSTTARRVPCRAVGSSSVPKICVSSPRITSGTPAASRHRRPGTIDRRVPGTAVNAAAIAPKSAGQSRYGASIHPWRLPIMPQAIIGTSSPAPSSRSARSAPGNPPAATFCTPRGALFSSSTRPRVSSRYARAELVPQSIAISAVDMAEVRGSWIAAPGIGLRRQPTLPACRFFVVARARLHPALAGGRVLLFPERRARLQVVHDELARREGVAAMCAGDGYQDDLIGRLELADAVDHQRVVDVPARFRLVDDCRQRLLGHARIMLEREGLHGSGLVDVAHETDECRDSAYARIAGAQCRDLPR